jgi:hypothetical protein
MVKPAFFALVAWCGCTLLVAQEPAAVTVDEQGREKYHEDFELLKAYYRHSAEQYEFVLDAAGQEKLTLEPTVMTWTGEDYKFAAATVAPLSGEVYVWTRDGRAIVAGGIGSFPYATGRAVFHEFHVLTEQTPPRTPIHSDIAMAWEPEGLTPRPIPEAPEPAPTPSRRLIQMRKLAQEFQGRTTNPEETGVAKLRLLPAPIFRLDADALKAGKHNIVDGALFVYTGEVGTDSEMMLYIECRQTDDGLEWTYVPAAMTYLEMWLEHKGVEVWHIPNYRVSQGEHNYFTAIVERPSRQEDLRARINEKK